MSKPSRNASNLPKGVILRLTSAEHVIELRTMDKAFWVFIDKELTGSYLQMDQAIAKIEELLKRFGPAE